MPSAPNSPRLDGVLRQVGVRAHAERAELVGPPEHLREVPVTFGSTSFTAPDHDLAGGAVDRDHVALADHGVAGRRLSTLDVDVEAGRAAHRGRAHAAGDDGGMAHEPAARREDPLRRDHPVEVVGRRLRPHEHDRLAALGGGLGVVGGEVHLADGRARRRVQALGDGRVVDVGVELRVQELVELRRVDPQHRLPLVDEPVLDHLHRDAQRGRRGALPDAGLEEEEAALLDRELDVAHVAVVLLEVVHRLEQLAVRLGEPLPHRVELLGDADAGDDVLALRVHEEVAVARRPRRWPGCA